MLMGHDDVGLGPQAPSPAAQSAARADAETAIQHDSRACSAVCGGNQCKLRLLSIFKLANFNSEPWLQCSQ